MFAKLFRREWKECGTVFLLVCCGLLVMSLVNLALVFAQSVYVVVIRAILAYTGMLLGMGGLVGIFIWLLIRYQSSMFGKQGYLVRVIPVKTESLFTAKFFSGFLMLFVLAWFALGCFYASFVNFFTVIYTAGEGTGVKFEDVLDIAGLDFTANDWVHMGYIALIVLLVVLFVFAFGVLVSTLSNLGGLQKSNVLFTILFGLGGIFALEAVILVVESYLPVYYNLTLGRLEIGVEAYNAGSELVILDGGYIVPTQLSISFPFMLLLFAVLFYFIGRNLASKKCGVK